MNKPAAVQDLRFISKFHIHFAAEATLDLVARTFKSRCRRRVPTDTYGKFATGVNSTGGNFATGIKDTSGKFGK
jgi:hypothetical protein